MVLTELGIYKIRKSFTVSAAHSLKLNYDSGCRNKHGHNWKITIHCRCRELNESGMVVDFSHIKKQIKGELDHKDLDSILPFNSTAENLAKWCVDQIKSAYKCEIEEVDGSAASYEIPD